MNLKRRRRKCLFCRELFTPDPRNLRHQRFCSQELCKLASKALSQKRWSAKPDNKAQWQGTDEVDRVRLWRKAHPQYWKRPGKAKPVALQENCLADPVAPESLKPNLALQPLQEICFTQHPLIVGLISMLTASTLQEDIALTGHRLITKGREILGSTPATHTQNYDEQKTPGSAAVARAAQPV